MVKEVEVNRLQKGAYFGEIALITNRGRECTVTAVGAVKCMAIERDTFTRVLGPLIDVLKRNMENYSKLDGAELEAEHAEIKGEYEDDEPVHLDDDEVAAVDTFTQELAPLMKAPPSKGYLRKKRKTVFVEPMNIEAAWQPKIIPKSLEDTTRLRGYFKNTKLFSHLDEDSLATIVNAMGQEAVKDQQEVIRQGDRGDFFYLLDEGSAEVLIRQPGQKESEKVLDYAPGDSFGELALLHGDVRAATVRATSNGKVWKLDRDTFRRILMTHAFNKQREAETFVKSIPLFASLTKYELFRLVDSLLPEAFQDGDVIIKEGEPGDKFYIISEGCVVCTKSVEGDPESAKELAASLKKAELRVEELQSQFEGMYTEDQYKALHGKVADLENERAELRATLQKRDNRINTLLAALGREKHLQDLQASL